jgi:endoglucanase
MNGLKQKGITLIALVVTIVVLLILAGVSINLLLGDNGIITMAQKAKKQYEEAAKLEGKELAATFERNYSNYNGALHVNNGKLINQYDENIQLKGLVSGQLNKYSDHFSGTPTFKYYINQESINNLKSWGINVIRLGVEIDQTKDEKIMQDYFDTIDLLVKNNIYVVAVLWNSENIYNNVDIAKEYFNELSLRYNDNHNIIYEIANEPSDKTQWDEIKKYSNEIIPIIRKNSKENIIIIPSPSWDGSPNLIKMNELVETNNIMVAQHMYTGQQLNEENISKIQEAINNGTPIFVTEWGTTMANGNDGFYEAYSNAFVKFMDNNKLSWCNFCITDMNFQVGYGKEEEEYSGIVQHNKWNNSLSEDILTESGKYIKNILLNNCFSYNNGDYAIMIKRNDELAFWQEKYRNKITSIEFKAESSVPENAIQCWDISFLNDKKVWAYIINDETQTENYKLYIISSNCINLPIDCGSLFSDFNKVTNIKFENIKSDNVRNLSRLFYNDNLLLNIDGLNKMNTKNVIFMYDTFFECSSLKYLDLSGWNISKVRELTNLFSDCVELEEIKGINNWDANNITGMSCTFMNCQNIRNIDLSKWNLKNVSNMKQTFWNMKKLKNLYLNNTEFNLDILKKYDEIITGCQEEINVYVKNLNSAEFISNRLKENNITAQIYYGNDNTLYSE